MEKIINKRIFFMILLLLFYIGVINTFSQDYTIVKLIFHKDIISNSITFPKYNSSDILIDYKENEDSLFCFLTCKFDTTYLKAGIIIDECKVYDFDKIKFKKVLFAFFPAKYKNVRILIIHFRRENFYFEIDKKKKKVFNLYKIG